MILVRIPGYKSLVLKHLVLDYNGTLAEDGEPLPGIKEQLEKLFRNLEIHILTADTFGKVRQRMEGYQGKIVVLSGGNQHNEKKRYIMELGPDEVIALGNGRNDREMLKFSALGIAVINREGMSVEAALSADIICFGINDALNLPLNPKRLIATLRS